MQHAIRQIDQTRRRVIHGEVIPHDEKVFSIFEPHTEWISKGKAGVPVELGVKVCILEDQHQFILHHQVMQKQTDDQVAVSMVGEAKKRLTNLNACSFDKGFHSPGNHAALKAQLEQVVLPRKDKHRNGRRRQNKPGRSSRRDTRTRRSSRRLTRSKCMGSTGARIMASTDSSAMLHWPWWQEIFTTSATSCGNRHSSVNREKENIQVEPHHANWPLNPHEKSFSWA